VLGLTIIAFATLHVAAPPASSPPSPGASMAGIIRRGPRSTRCRSAATATSRTPAKSCGGSAARSTQAAELSTMSSWRWPTIARRRRVRLCKPTSTLEVASCSGATRLAANLAPRKTPPHSFTSETISVANERRWQTRAETPVSPRCSSASAVGLWPIAERRAPAAGPSSGVAFGQGTFCIPC